MKCPILDSNGNHRSLHTLTYNDLSQLLEISEGYVVEYKETFDKSVKEKLPKEIISFANASGGWIFVGVKNDGTVVNIPKQSRTDYGQTIGQIVKRSVSPQPYIDFQFIENPQSESNGVLVIEVKEGIEPPYITNGSIFVRTGSCSEKYKFNQPADAYMLMDLYRKSREINSTIDSFCQRTIYFPPTSVRYGVEQFRFPLFNIYLKALGVSGRYSVSADQIDSEKEQMRLAFEKTFSGQCVCHPTHNSLQFRKRIQSPVDEATTCIELFYDGSIKACIPFALLQNEERENAIRRLQRLGAIGNVDIMRIVDGLTSAALLMNTCSVIDDYIALKQKNASNYVLAYEFENAQGSFVEFRNDGFDEYVRENGFMFIGATDQKSRPFTFDRFDFNAEIDTIHQYMLMHFIEGCGVPYLTADETAKKRILQIMFGNELADKLDFENPA